MNELDDYNDAITAALHADAEAAREEIRALGLICPSCGGNAGDLYGRHCLVIVATSDPACPEAECRDGQRVPIDSYERYVAASNIFVLDAAWFREGIEFQKTVIGAPRPGGYDGLLGSLGL